MLTEPFSYQQSTGRNRSSFVTDDSLYHRTILQAKRSFEARLADDMQQNMTPCGHCHRAISQQLIQTGEDSNFNAKACGLCKVYAKSEKKWASWLDGRYYPIPSDHHTAEGFARMAPMMICFECRKVSCQQDCCPVTQKCGACQDQICTKCLKMKSCKFCARVYCSTSCSGIDQCSSGCGVESICEMCRLEARVDDVAISVFAGCEAESCDNCNEVSQCSFCEGNYCIDCGMSGCSECGREICEEHLRSCDLCGSLSCPSSGCQTPCLICDYVFCNECIFQGVCDTCRPSSRQKLLGKSKTE